MAITTTRICRRSHGEPVVVSEVMDEITFALVAAFQSARLTMRGEVGRGGVSKGG